MGKRVKIKSQIFEIEKQFKYPAIKTLKRVEYLEFREKITKLHKELAETEKNIEKTKRALSDKRRYYRKKGIKYKI